MNTDTYVAYDSIMKEENFRAFDNPVSFDITMYGTDLKATIVGQIVNPYLPAFVVKFSNGAREIFYPQNNGFGWAMQSNHKSKDIYAQAVSDALGAILFEGGLDIQYSQLIPDDQPPAPIEKYVPAGYHLTPTDFLFRKQIGFVVYEVWATALKSILDRTFYIAIIVNSSGLFKEIFMDDAGNWLAAEQSSGKTEYLGGGYLEELGRLIEEHYF